MKAISAVAPRVSLLVAILVWIATASWSAEATYAVQLESKTVSGQVGQPLEIRIELAAKNLPSGLMYTVIVDGLTYPGTAAPEILPGIPSTAVTCRLPGTYLLRVRVNLVSKTSCGSASFETLLEEEVKLSITDSE